MSERLQSHTHLSSDMWPAFLAYLVQQFTSLGLTNHHYLGNAAKVLDESPSGPQSQAMRIAA